MSNDPQGPDELSHTAYVRHLDSTSTPRHSKTIGSHVEDGGVKAEQLAHPPPSAPLTGRWTLYASCLLMVLPSAQVSWAMAQINYTGFHNTKDCSARPVEPGTCLMFPGHSPWQWTLIVNVLLASGVLGCLLCGRLSEKYGRKRLAIANTAMIVVAALIQALAPTPGVYILGRLFSGFGGGIATTLPNGYINEVSPPHLRSKLGVLFSMSMGLGTVLVTGAMFFAKTTHGWRYLAAGPILWCGPFVLAAPSVMVESPSWLLLRGRQADAERELTRLFGPAHVQTALDWLNISTAATAPPRGGVGPWRGLFAPGVRRQTLTAMTIIMSLQMAGINLIFMYSSSMFKIAGLSDPRSGSLIIAVMYLLPSLFSGHVGTRFGTRRTILFGQGAMIVCGLAVTAALWAGRAVPAITSLSLYVVLYASGFAPISYVVVVSLFPNALRSYGAALALAQSWGVGLVLGVIFPYVTDALGAFALVPYVALLGVFGALTFRLLPDTTNKTNDEIQALFQAQPTPRKRKRKGDPVAGTATTEAV